MKRKYIQVDGLKVRLDKRKNYKNIKIKVIPPYGEIAASCPEYITDKMIKAFIRKNIKSIRRTIEKQKSIYGDRIETYEDGSRIKVFGKDFYLNIVKGSKNEGNFNGNDIVLALKNPNDKDLIKKELDKLLRNYLRKNTDFFIRKYTKEMNIDIEGFSIRKMKTKWGTCNITDRFIWINFELVKYKLDCLEYIVVHELCHLIEKNHGKEFYKLVEKYYPSYKEIEEFLDKQIIVS